MERVVCRGDALHRDNLRDVGGLIAYPLHVRYHFESGGNQAQVARDRLLLQKELQAERLDVSLLPVNLHFGVRDFLRKVCISPW